jgi:hypothetical protein
MLLHQAEGSTRRLARTHARTHARNASKFSALPFNLNQQAMEHLGNCILSIL